MKLMFVALASWFLAAIFAFTSCIFCLFKLDAWAFICIITMLSFMLLSVVFTLIHIIYCVVAEKWV